MRLITYLEAYTPLFGQWMPRFTHQHYKTLLQDHQGARFHNPIFGQLKPIYATIQQKY